MWLKKTQPKIYIEKYKRNKNHFHKEIDQNEFMSNNKRKNVCETSKYIENF